MCSFMSMPDVDRILRVGFLFYWQLTYNQLTSFFFLPQLFHTFSEDTITVAMETGTDLRGQQEAISRVGLFTISEIIGWK